MNRQCTCKDCGKVFEFGDEGDNEKFCLRCEAVFMVKVDSGDGDFIDGDEQ